MTNQTTNREIEDKIADYNNFVAEARSRQKREIDRINASIQQKADELNASIYSVESSGGDK